MLLLTDGGLSTTQILSIIRWLPVWLFASLPLNFCLSWIIDIAIYTKKEVGEISEYPGLIQRFGYRALSAIARANFKLLFHYKPIDARNVPEWGGVLLTANHSSFLDPLLLACGTDRLIQFVIYASYYRSFAHPLFRFLRSILEDESGQLGALRTGVRSLKL